MRPAERGHAFRAGGGNPGLADVAQEPGASAPEKGNEMTDTMEKGQPGGQGQPGHDRDKDRKQGQQQQEPGRNPQPGGGQGDRSGQGGQGDRNR